MAESRPTMPVDTAEVPRAQGDAARVLVREGGAQGVVNLRLTAPEIVHPCLGISLPTTPKWVEAIGVTVLWQAFDEWLLVTQDGAQDALLERLREGLAGHHASLVDVSDFYVSFEIGGPSSRDLLAKGCAVDIHPRTFGAGDCAPCAFARVRVTLRQLDDTPRFELLVERSYAHYLRDWLTDAAAEFLGT